jgi:hypothetical protein
MLDLKMAGVGPQSLAEQIVGTIDCSQFFLLQGRETINTPVLAVPVLGPNFPGMVVPAGELWYVWNYTAQCVLGAGMTLEVCCSWNPDGTTAFSAMLGDFTAAGAAQAVMARAAIPGFWAAPGSNFGFWVRAMTLLPQVQVGATISRFRI